MQILVDADACPVVGIVEQIAKKYNIPVTLLCDTNHVLQSDYSEVSQLDPEQMQLILSWSVSAQKVIL